MNWYDSVPLSRITNQLFLGGYVQGAMLAHRNPAAITNVLNVSTESSYQENPFILYKHLPFADGHEIPREQFWKCMQFLSFHYKAGGKILTHCAAGISRSVVITASFLHYADLMDFNDALSLIKQRRPISNPAIDVLNSAKNI